jgi:hypothetical protein
VTVPDFPRAFVRAKSLQGSPKANMSWMGKLVTVHNFAAERCRDSPQFTLTNNFALG